MAKKVKETPVPDFSPDRGCIAGIKPHERAAVHFDPDLGPAGKWVFRASAIGKCPLKLALLALGRREFYNEKQTTAFAAGHEHEAIVKDRLRRRGIVVDEEQRVLEMDLGVATIQGHWDGQATHKLFGASMAYGAHHLEGLEGLISAGWDLGPACLEVKSMREDDFMSFLARGLADFPEYERQVSLYSAISGLPIIFAAQCKSDLAMHLRYYPAPPIPLGEILAHVGKVLALIASLEGGDRPLCHEHPFQKWPCQFEDFHDSAAMEVVGEIEDPAGEVARMAESYCEIGRQIVRLEDEKKDLRSALEDALSGTKHRKAKAGAFTLQKVTTTSKDYSALIRDNPTFAALLPNYERSNQWLRVDGPRKKT